MSGRFNWQTDDEQNWSAPESPRRPRLSRRLRTVLLASGLLAVLLITLYQISQRRLAQLQAGLRSEIRAAHTTWLTAVARGDLELLTTLSAREDAGWFTAQRRLLLAERTLDRPAFGLRVTPAAATEQSIALSPDQTTAELLYRQPYAVAGGGDETVTLEQIAFYERTGPIWLRRAPTAEEWGPILQRASAQVIATFPERDADLVNRLALDLSDDLGDLCRQMEQAHSASRLCDEQGRIRLAFETDPEALLLLNDDMRPALAGLTFRLPTPTLVGRPLDDAGYARLYHGYTDRILMTLRRLAEPPIPLPEQDIAALCFTSPGSRLTLLTYRPDDDSWTPAPEGSPYRTFWPLPDDDGLILRAGLPGIDLDRLQLSLRRDGSDRPLLDVGRSQLTASLAGITVQGDNGGLLLRLGQGSTGVASYAWASLPACTAGDCELLDLPGYPVWSPDGRLTLLSDVGRLLLGDDLAHPTRELDDGFNPFWLSPTLFGYVALPDDQSDDMRLVVEDAVSGEQMVLTDGRSLMLAVDPAVEGSLRIRYVTTSPADPTLVLVGGTPAGNSAGDYVILAQRLSGSLASAGDLAVGPLQVLARLPSAPVADPARYTPTGSPPFNVSADGRWLVAVRFTDVVTNAWALHLIDLAGGASRVINTNHPPYPAQFPFFDWSADGRWLVVVDDGYLRLVAPDYDHERVVAHEYRSCSSTAWLNR